MLIDELILIAMSGWWVGLTVRVGINCGVLMRIRRGSGESELLSVSGGPICVFLCRGLGVKVLIIKRRSANHGRWGMSGIGRTGMVREGIRGGRGEGGRGGMGRERPGRASRLRWGSR